VEEFLQSNQLEKLENFVNEDSLLQHQIGEEVEIPPVEEKTEGPESAYTSDMANGGRTGSPSP
jgi:hypothetical protein